MDTKETFFLFVKLPNIPNKVCLINKKFHVFNDNKYKKQIINIDTRTAGKLV